ncbi:AAA family ATPase [Nocardia aurea]|uniref:ATP-binding protein n=1 Tax=Nocardia aurea TaxID=2144174 RepID=A0ABV3G3Z7_9NOCA
MTDKANIKARTMLVAFRATNVRSFRDPLEFSMEGTAVSEPSVPRELPWRKGGRTPVRVLPVAGVFGANASGKTNLLRAMDDMRRIVLTSFAGSTSRRRKPRRILRPPFKLDPGCVDAPSRYEVEVIIDGIRYEYGFEITDHEVISEWATHYPKGRPASIFKRSLRDLNFTGDLLSDQAKPLSRIMRPESLFLSVAGELEIPELEPLVKWFDENLLLCAAASRENRWHYTASLLKDESLREKVLNLIQIADLGITDVHTLRPDAETLERIKKAFESLSDTDEESEPFEIDEDTIVRFRMSHQGSHGVVDLDSAEESQGTLVWFGVAGPVISALTEGCVLLADELESSLHPELVAQLVKIFQDPKSNPNNAQLIFNSHEARLLGNSADDRTIGRDQAWFTEKDFDGSTRIYPLTDLNPRKSEAIARRYTEGRYGATPLVSGAEFHSLASDIAAS